MKSDLRDIVVVLGSGGQLDVVAVPKRDFLDFETLPTIWRRDVQGVVVVRTVWLNEADQIIQKFQGRGLLLGELVDQIGSFVTDKAYRPSEIKISLGEREANNFLNIKGE